MELTDSKVIELVKKKPHYDKIVRGLDYESRLKIMTEPLFREEIIQERGYIEMTNLMRAHLGFEKGNRTLEFMTFPLVTVGVTHDCLLDLYKVFDSRNSSFKNQYINTTVEQRMEQLLAQIDVRKFIEKVGKKVLKNEPNTFIVVDKDEKGVPYLLDIDNDDILGYDWSEENDNQLEYFIFEHSEYKNEQGKEVKRVGFYDAFAYYVLEETSAGQYTVIVKNPHGLGYCPVAPFFNKALNNSNDFNRWNPFAQILTLLLRYTTNDTYLNFAELYSTFPVIKRQKPQCNNEECTDGIIRIPIQDGGYQNTECKTCKANSGLVGPGTIINDPPRRFEAEADNTDTFQFIAPPIDGITFEQQQQEKRASDIKIRVTGVSQVMEKEAVNVEQVMSVMAAAKDPLQFIAFMLNDLHKFLVETIVKLATSTDVTVHANYGTEWYILSESDLQKLFENSKLVGFPESEQEEIYKQLIETKYKGNPNTINRLIIENNLNPAPFKTIEECYKMQEKGILSREDLAIKANITAFIKRFERENGSIVAFGKDAIANNTMTFEQKINNILEIFKTYITNEQSTSQQIGQQGNQGTAV
jgi:hypothetical protein